MRVFEYFIAYQARFADSLKSLVRYLLESGEEIITPSLENNLELMDVQDEADFQMWLKRDTLTYKPIRARLSVPLTLELARSTVNAWIALSYKDLEWDQLQTLVFLNGSIMESPLSVLAQEPGERVRLLTPEEMQMLFRVDKLTKSTFEGFAARLSKLNDLIKERGEALGLPLYNEAGQPLEYFVFGNTYD